jgi:uncharacterized double-CXXCG motif protein
MRLFKMARHDDPRFRGFADASHRWGLPGVTCSTCGNTWSCGGQHYPTVNLHTFPNASRYADLSPVSPEELRTLADAVQPLLKRDDIVLLPGADFGPVHGEAKGKLPSVIYPNITNPCIDADSMKRLTKAGVRGLRGARAELSNARPDYVELELPPLVGAVGVHPTPCARCGYSDICVPSQITLERPTIPANEDIFRGSELSTCVFVTERFVEAANQIPLTGVRFVEVALTDVN